MNIFYLHEDPRQCAEWHIDKHVVKMPTEYAQLLSTAHRMLDGKLTYITRVDANGRSRKVKRWIIDDDRNENVYQAGHYNHPSARWVRESKANYMFLFQLYTAVLAEHRVRYGWDKKPHGASKPWLYLMRAPNNIPDIGRTQMPQAMAEFPQCMVDGDPIQAYRNFYNVAKKNFATWRVRSVPDWFSPA